LAVKEIHPQRKSEGGARRYRFRPRVFDLSSDVARAAASVELFELLGRLRGHRPVLLDSAGGRPAHFSLLAFDPLPIGTPASLGELRRLHGRLESKKGDPVPGFFHGGFLGALAYEAVREFEPELVLPDDPLGLPSLVGGFYTDFLVRDERSGGLSLVLGEDPGDARPSIEERRARIVKALEGDDSRSSLIFHAQPERHVSKDVHLQRIDRARDWIARGEIYQANVTQRFSREVEGSPGELYRCLRALQPTPYAGFLSFEGGALLSASPELLLEYIPPSDDTCAALARTRPIKGTAPRSADPDLDRMNAEGLLQSEKDLAELGMIVDLERNDLGRIASTDSVRVDGYPTLESYSTVHHLAADVTCRPVPEADALTCLQSLFPGGSITGAPKLRSMEILSELEEEGRGFFYGSLFSLDTRGRMQANLLIRTLVWREAIEKGERARVHYRVGGAITWSSDPELEERECRWKGEALARALGGEGGRAISPLLLPR
jgi:para-aminobenzoate synthetase component 1